MSSIPPELLPQSQDDLFLTSPYKERWEKLRPIIVKLYTGNYGKNGKSTTLSEVVDFMRINYKFHAAYVHSSLLSHFFHALTMALMLTSALIVRLSTQPTSVVGKP